jgi:hypothetical protein
MEYHIVIETTNFKILDTETRLQFYIAHTQNKKYY